MSTSTTTAVTFEPYDPLGDLEPGLRALEASAGTGKTFAITSTVLRMVVERDAPLDMRRVLLVTFTRAATAELEDRLRRRLAGAAAALTAVEAGGPPDERWDEVLAKIVRDAVRHGTLATARARVDEALRTVDAATVTTIHGFCHQVLQQSALAADSDPGVVLDTDDDRLVTAVVDDWLVAFTHDHDERLAALLAAVSCTRRDLLALARTVAGEPAPLLAPAVVPAVDVDEVLAAEDAVRAALGEADQLLAVAHEAVADGRLERTGKYTPTRADRLPNRIAKVVAGYAAGSPKDTELGVLDPYGDAADERDEGALMPGCLADEPLPRAVRRARRLRWAFEAWVRRSVADHVLAELGRRRARAGSASFADLLRRLDAAVRADGGDVLAAEVRAQFDVALVDEFQDTDPVQWRILRALFAGVERFDVVGDPKQAIYGWRGADLATYTAARSNAERVFTMTRNFRSDAAYVAACNRLMDRTGSLGDPEVAYVPVTPVERTGPRLVAVDGTDAAGMQLVFLRGVGGRAAADLRTHVAERVAEDVVATLRSGLRLPEQGGRTVEARDCTVLVRRHTEAAAVADALRRRGVAVVVGGGEDVLQSPEAGHVADLLRVLLAPGDGRALHRLLVGPFVGLDAAELVALTDEERQVHHDRIADWARTWADGGVAAAVQRATREGRAEARLSGQRDGDRTMTNIRHLTELLHLAEQEEALGAHALAAWFDARRAEAEEDQTPPERELRLERDDAAVQVLTVHASKGLQFPLVWVPFLWSPEGRREGAAPFVVNDPANGHRRTVSLHAASSGALRAASDQRVALRAAYDRAEWEAGMRLAYVALTRAEHRCTVHLAAQSYGAAVTRSAAWQLLWRDLLDGAPDSRDERTVDEGAMLGVLHELDGQGHVTVREVGAETPVDGTAWVGVGAAVPTLAARRWTRAEPLDVRWGRTSYTGLLRARATAARDEVADAEPRDHDGAASGTASHLDDLPEDSFAGLPDVPLAPLPRGADWGTFLHAVLEHADFDADVDGLARQVFEAGRDLPVRDLDEHAGTVATGLHRALATPLGPRLDDLRLADVGRADRLDELAFTLTLGEDAPVTLGAIADVFDRHAAAADAPLGAAAAHLRGGGSGVPVHGLLGGAIDLVLRHEGRFWIADYKSNGLGQLVEDAGSGTTTWRETDLHTSPDRVATKMLGSDYLLQAHLYVVALHRYLGARLRGYDYDEHVGGWAYLFLRGMTGPDVPRAADGTPHGVAAGRPTRALVEDLDALLRLGAGTGGDAR